MGKTTATGSPTTSDPTPVIKKSKSKKNASAAVDETTTPKDSGSSLTEPKSPDRNITKVSTKESKISPKATPEEVPSPESPKKSKKRKHRTEDADTTNNASPSQKDTPEEPSRKKHKNRTEFKDPREDTALNSQSRKALEYAFLQMNRPSKWKFNKARQNWLIRNIWNPESVSDIYFPFVVKYLTNIQGGSREKLKESCQIHIQPEAAETAVPVTEPTTPAPKSILKVAPPLPKAALTPGPLIDATPTPGALIFTDAATSIPAAVSSSSAEALASVRRQRAHILLDALCSDTSTRTET